MRIALIVGIDYYEHAGLLHGCVDDAHSVNAVLGRHDINGGAINFDCKISTGTGPTDRVDRGDLRDDIETLFSRDADISLFYFAGHGFVDAAGGYLLGTDARRGDDGVSLVDILTFANSSPAKNKVIILDSCHSGVAGMVPTAIKETAALAKGLTVLTASTKEQEAKEEDGKGIFTTLFVDALRGGAASLTGDITPGSVYAHIDQSLGWWQQRPVFKTNVEEFVSLRSVSPPIHREELRRIAEFFPSPGYRFPLDPSYEPEMKGRDEGMPLPDPEKNRVFAILQKYNRLNLLVPVDVPHMWNAAMESKACQLTALGEHYRSLVAKNRL